MSLDSYVHLFPQPFNESGCPGFVGPLSQFRFAGVLTLEMESRSEIVNAASLVPGADDAFDGDRL